MCKGGCLPSDPLGASRLRRVCEVEAIGSWEKFTRASPSLCQSGPRECTNSKHIKVIVAGYWRLFNIRHFSLYVNSYSTAVARQQPTHGEPCMELRDSASIRIKR